MNKITINGQTMTAGRNITITNGRVFVDGKDHTPDTREISIHVDGNVDAIQADACSTITVSGSASNIATASGDVSCGDVAGSVSTMSGDIHCRSISGSARTMSGSITRS